MQSQLQHKVSFITALKRELAYYRYNGRECFIAIAILLASMTSVAWVFSSGTLTNLPIAVIDNDNSSLSRSYIRMLEAAPEIHIVEQLTSTTQARELLEQASIYAFVLIPNNFAKDIKTGRQTNIASWSSGQYLTISSTISKSLRQVTGTLSAGIEITSLNKRIDSSLAARVNYSPIQSELRTLFNPYQNYQFFIVSSLLPAMLQMFVMIWTVFVVGRELQDNTWAQWLNSGSSVYSIVTAKLLPIFIIASVIGFACIFWLFGISGWPVNGSLSLLILGWELMILAYLVLGVLFTSLTKNLATGLSFTIFFTAPAFAYVGITFPQHAMPLIAQIWTYILPVRSLLRLQVEQVEMAAPVINSLPEILILLCFIALPTPLIITQIRRRCKTADVGC